ncbi:Uncharacterised protein [Serratia rubidaea]|uniref:Alcohol dehydrogenase-like N-terminal domain-containing protein n=1 Tax=Serratia rubidaea TaxID=61652 RepID=A0A3S4GIB6_SERRU|nr:Uncharacterised protein [Serratia rubidaea]
MINSALWYREFGAPEAVLRLENAPPAALTAGNVRVAMRLAPVNASDLIPLSGAYRHRVVPPAVAGYEGVGVVTETTPGRSICSAGGCCRCGARAPGSAWSAARRRWRCRCRTR